MRTTRWFTARTRPRITGGRPDPTRTARAANGSAGASTPYSGAPSRRSIDAHRCLEIVDANADGSIEDWDEPAAREALARAQLVAGDVEASRREVEHARRLAALIADAEDRTIIESDLAVLG
jgi:hypothetical protein